MYDESPVSTAVMTDQSGGARSALPLLDLLRLMETARQGDRREGILLRQGKGWFSVGGMGQEAVAALSYLLTDDDWLFPYYRDRALCMARGLTTYDLALAFFASEDSISRGRQMPGHHGSSSLHIFSVPTPTASQCIPAAGAAWVLKNEGLGRIVLCCVGDAAIRQGEYYEAIALAIQESLPLVMVVEDNGYGISTPTDRMNPYRLGILDSTRVIHVDGSDVEAVYDAGRTAVEAARAGRGPYVLWCAMPRLCSHTSSDDHRVYRSEEELVDSEARDPILRLSEQLISDGALSREAWSADGERIAAEVAADYERAASAPIPKPSSVTEHVYAPTPPPATLPEELAARLTGPDTTMVSAIVETLGEALGTDPAVHLFGEDIEDPKGGVFGLTKGLSSRFPGRVVNAPLAEATIVGVAVGMAALGRRPVFELQFIDFAGLAYSQISNQAATLRWRTAGDQSCPMVLMAPAGAYLPGGGIWHSQTGEGIWAHIPGLRICMPSTPADAATMLWDAIYLGDPVLYLIPKHLFRQRMGVQEISTIGPGRLRVRREGADVTLVTWGNGTELGLACAAEAERENIDVEVLDLRWLNPCDWDGMIASVEKTGRLVVLHEDARTGGFGDTIVAEMVSHTARWNLFLAPPQIVARHDVPVPFAPSLEYAALPDQQRVMAAVREVMK